MRSERGAVGSGPAAQRRRSPTRTRTLRVRSSAVTTAPRRQQRTSPPCRTPKRQRPRGACRFHVKHRRRLTTDTRSPPLHHAQAAVSSRCAATRRRTSIDNPTASRSCTRPRKQQPDGTPRRAEAAHPDRRPRGRETQCSGCSSPRTPSLTRRGHHGQRGAQLSGLSAQFTCLTQTPAAQRTRRETHSAQGTTTDGARREPRAANGDSRRTHGAAARRVPARDPQPPTRSPRIAPAVLS